MSEPAKDEAELVDAMGEAMSGWPDHEKPGVPLHPDVDGFHWLGNAAFVWVAKCGNWGLNGVGFPPEFFANTFYHGPCLTPAETDALRAENARLREALENSAIMIQGCYDAPTNPDSLPQMLLHYIRAALEVKT
jgi:hypothetical protein